MWFKRFFIGYFSNRLLKEQSQKGYLNIVAALLLALAIIFCGVLGGNLLPLNSQYNDADDFKNTIYNLFENHTITVVNGKAKVNGDSAVAVDTFLNESDRQIYGLYGYEVVIDTRRTATTFDDFECYFETADGNKILYEDYRSLSDALKKNYTFKVIYTGREVELTDENAEGWKSFLNSSADETVRNALTKLESENLTGIEYKAAVYELYVSAFYPDMSNYESGGGAPKIRNFYNQEYRKNNSKKYFFIFEDVVVSGFVTDRNIEANLYGVFDNFENGYGIVSADGVDGFVSECYKSSQQLIVFSCLNGFLNFGITYILLMLILAFFSLLIHKGLGLEEGCYYGANLRLIGGIYLWSSIFTAIISIVFGFIVSVNKVFYISVIAFVALLIIRMALYFIFEKIALNKANKQADGEEEDIFDYEKSPVE